MRELNFSWSYCVDRWIANAYRWPSKREIFSFRFLTLQILMFRQEMNPSQCIAIFHGRNGLSLEFCTPHTGRLWVLVFHLINKLKIFSFSLKSIAKKYSMEVIQRMYHTSIKM